MDEHYDVIVLGTGLKECILSGLLSVSGRKVLHLDRNDYYGGESSSFNLQQIKQHLDGMSEEEARAWGQEQVETFGRSKEYNVDLCPKFIMASGDLVKLLLHTKVTRYLEFKCVDGSYVWKREGNKIHEVPVTPDAVLASPLMGMLQKRRFKNFLEWCLAVDENNAETFACKSMMDMKQISSTIEDARNVTPAALMDWWKIDTAARDFTGHAICLYNNDNYLKDKRQVLPLIKRIKLYADSLARYEKSPYIYPLWGLGGLPEGFSRLAAVHGGVYMLRRPIQEVLYNDDGTVRGIMSQGETATCDQLIGDPSYFMDMCQMSDDAGGNKIKPSGYVCRVIRILSAPIPNTNQGAESCQLILSSIETGHPADIYVSCISKGLECAPQNRFVAVVSARVESDDEAAALEALQPALQLLEPVTIHQWVSIRPTYVPINQQHGDNVFIPSSMDASTHFQLCAREVNSIYAAMTGAPIDLNSKPEENDGAEN